MGKAAPAKVGKCFPWVAMVQRRPPPPPPHTRGVGHLCFLRGLGWWCLPRAAFHLVDCVSVSPFRQTSASRWLAEFEKADAVSTVGRCPDCHSPPD